MSNGYGLFVLQWRKKKAEKKLGSIRGSGMKSLESLILELTISSKQTTFKISFK